jgi:hypothetical protein
MESSPSAHDEVIVELPPPVEGRVPSKQEMQFKASNGPYYLDDVWKIEREFPTADKYETPTDLPNLANTLYAQVRDIGYTLHDSSDKLNNVHHALEMTMAWAKIVREARTTDTMHIVRRTPENSGAMLMIQRQEHLRGQCSEMAPISYIALVRDDQLVVTRDRVPDQDSTERILLMMARSKDDCCICGEFLRRRESTSLTRCGHCVHTDCLKLVLAAGELSCPQCKMEMDDKDKPISAFSALGEYSSNAEKREEAIERAKLSGERRHLTNMPNAFFNQQMQAMMESMKAISVQAPEEDPWVEVEVDLSELAQTRLNLGSKDAESAAEPDGQARQASQGETDEAQKV